MRQLITTKSGYQLLIIDGYIYYRKQRNTKGIETWRCSFFRASHCSMRCRLLVNSGDIDIYSNSEASDHNHAPPTARIAILLGQAAENQASAFPIGPRSNELSLTTGLPFANSEIMGNPDLKFPLSEMEDAPTTSLPVATAVVTALTDVLSTNVRKYTRRSKGAQKDTLGHSPTAPEDIGAPGAAQESMHPLAMDDDAAARPESMSPLTTTAVVAEPRITVKEPSSSGAGRSQIIRGLAMPALAQSGVGSTPMITLGAADEPKQPVVVCAPQHIIDRLVVLLPAMFN